MKSTKLDNDKYYTPIDLAKECIDKTKELMDEYFPQMVRFQIKFQIV